MEPASASISTSSGRPLPRLALLRVGVHPTMLLNVHPPHNPGLSVWGPRFGVPQRRK